MFQKGVRLPFFPHHISSQIPQTMTSSSEFPSMMRLCNQFNTFIGVTCTVIYIKFQTVVRLWGFSYQMLMDWLVTVSSLFWYLPGQYSMLSPRAWSLPISSSSVLSVCRGCTRWTLQMASPWCILRSMSARLPTQLLHLVKSCPGFHCTAPRLAWPFCIHNYPPRGGYALFSLFPSSWFIVSPTSCYPLRLGAG